MLKRQHFFITPNFKVKYLPKSAGELSGIYFNEIKVYSHTEELPTELFGVRQIAIIQFDNIKDCEKYQRSIEWYLGRVNDGAIVDELLVIKQELQNAMEILKGR